MRETHIGGLMYPEANVGHVMRDPKYIVELDGRTDIDTIGGIVEAERLAGVGVEWYGIVPFPTREEDQTECIYVRKNEEGYITPADQVVGITDIDTEEAVPIDQLS